MDPNGKGKGKAMTPESAPGAHGASTPSSSHSHERAPLLPSSPDASSESPRRKQVRHGRGPLVRDSDDEGSLRSQASSTSLRRRASRSLSSRLTLSTVACIFFVFFVFVLLLVFAIVHLWLGHLVAEQAKSGSLEEMAERGLLVEGPSQFGMTDNGDDGLVVSIVGRAGVDVRRALGWENKDQAGWIRRTEARLGRWAVNKVAQAGVTVTQITVSSTDDILVEIPFVDEMVLPLSYPSLNGTPKLADLTLELPIRFPNPDQLSAFAKAAWESKEVSVQLGIGQIEVKPGHVEGWFGKAVSKLGVVKVNDLRKPVRKDIPDVPGSSDPSSLVQLETYKIFQTPAPHHSSQVSLSASALLQNPLQNISLFPPHFSWGMPFHLPVNVLLPASSHHPNSTKSPIPLAKVVAEPFAFSNGANTSSLFLNGHLVPLPEDNKALREHAASVLSQLVANYLAGKNSTVLVQYDGDTALNGLSLTAGKPTNFPPSFVGQVIGNTTVPVELPGSTDGATEVFRNLGIEDMKISLSPAFMKHALSLSSSYEPDDADLFCSGKVVGDLALPGSFGSLAEAIDVHGLLPDVFVYDGELPDEKDIHRQSKRSINQAPFFAPSSPSSSSSSELDDPLSAVSYPPSPIPSNAFARLRPPSLIPSLTTHTPANATHNATTSISAVFVDAPLYLLPGRGEVFRRFVAKIVFGGPNAKVRCGVRGVAGVQVEIGGWGQVELEGLPCEGAFNVGRGGVESL